MTPHVRRRTRDPDPVVAARLQAISFADPYVFVHASDVIEVESPALEDYPAAVEPMGGWVPAPPPPQQPSDLPTAPPAVARAGPLWAETLRQRLEPSRTGFAALVLLGLIAAAVAAVAYLRAQPSPTTTALPAHSSTTVSVRTTPIAATPAPLLLVDVTGKVHRPGVVRLRSGARVIDAVRAAGGALPGTSLDSLNLASKLTDGQQVAVGGPAVPAGTGGGAGASPAAGASAAPVDLNAATLAELTTLPGIGPVLAQRILDYRTAHGPFASIDGLQQVGGIGPSKFADLKDHVTVQ